MRETERAVAEARGVVRDAMIATHEFTCGKVKKVRNKWVVDRLVRCSCGSDDNLQSHLDALIAAVRADERARNADTARLDWLDTQAKWTKWVGCDLENGFTVWPVKGSYRAAIDAARGVTPLEDADA